MRRLKGLLIAASLVPMQLHALEYAFPADPIAPENMTECDAIKAQYNAIVDQLRVQADQITENADRTLVVPSPAWRLAYAQASEVKEEAFRILMAGWEAANRCQDQVNAFNAVRREQEEAAKRSAEESFSATKGALREVPGLSLATSIGAGGRQAVNYLAGQGNFSAVAAQKAIVSYGIASTIQNLLMVINGQGYDGIRGGAELGILGVEAAGAFGPLSALLSTLAIAALINVHESAMKDLEEGFARFEDPLSTQLQLQNRALSQVLSPGRTTSGHGSDDLATLLPKAVETVGAALVDRSRASDTAMREAAEQRHRQEEARQREVAVRVPKKRQNPSGRSAYCAQLDAELDRIGLLLDEFVATRTAYEDPKARAYNQYLVDRSFSLTTELLNNCRDDQ